MGGRGGYPGCMGEGIIPYASFWNAFLLSLSLVLDIGVGQCDRALINTEKTLTSPHSMTSCSFVGSAFCSRSGES